MPLPATLVQRSSAVLWMTALFMWRAAAAEARYDVPETIAVPIERILRNLERQLAEGPRDGHLHLALGRVYGARWSSRARQLRVLAAERDGDEAKPHWSDFPLVPFAKWRRPWPAPNDDLVMAIEHHRRAVHYLVEHEGARLGLAYLLIQDERDRKEGMALLRELIARNFEADRDEVRRLSSARFERQPPVIAHEAIHYLMQLLDPKANRGELAALKEKRKALTPSRPSIVTPIAIPLAPVRDAPELVDRGARVHFDLDGFKRDRAWPWLNRDAGWLVWDPGARGRITSGLQLFGSFTFFIYWPDGYAALASLDDDSNGWLEGEELAGLGVWCDANGDGVSDPGEVRSLAALQITGIATVATRRTTLGPMHERGLRLRDGSTRPTFDLLLSPH